MPLWSQTDSRWANLPYFSDTSSTVGQIGCTLTSVAMVTVWATGNQSVTPATLNYKPRYDANAAALHATDLGHQIGHELRHLDEQGPPFTKIVKGSAEQAKLLIAIRNAISSGQRVVIGLEFGGPAPQNKNAIEQAISDNGWPRHTAVGVGVDGNGDIEIYDPAQRPGPSDHPISLSQYLNLPEVTGFDEAAAVSSQVQ
jgi:hypothetical protein